MNLKEAFRFQNKLQDLISKVEGVLSDESNITKVTNTVLKSKVVSSAENEISTELPQFKLFDLDGRVTSLVEFLMYLFEKRIELSYAIEKAKEDLPVDIDAETTINAKRQEIAEILGKMASVRNSEQIYVKAGVGYRFNTDGNQTPYKCDVKKVKTINFDRDKVKSYLKKLNSESDVISSKLDICLVTSNVDFEAPFDINDGFADIFDSYCSN